MFASIRLVAPWLARGASCLALAAALAGCGSTSPSSAGASAPAPSVAGTAAAPVATGVPGQATLPSTTTTVHQLGELSWAEGVVHVEVRGGFDAVIELPLAAGETVPGRTILTFEHREPSDSRYPLGLTRLVFVPDADSMGIDVGGFQVQGGCTYTFSQVAADALAAQFRCDDDLQAAFQGDPREVTITGSFEASR